MIEALIDNKYRETHVPTVKGLVCEIGDSKKLGSMIVFLTENYPLPDFNLNHIKRIDSKSKNPKRIFVCPVADKLSQKSPPSDRISVQNLNDSRLQNFLTDNGIEFLFVHDIPASIPITRIQNVNALKLWPINFHENKHLEKCLSNNVFNEQETLQINKCFGELFDQQSQHPASCSKMSVLITKDKRSTIVSKMTTVTPGNRDCSVINPLEHPVLRAIEDVSEKHRIAKGAKDNCPDELKHYQNDYLCTNYECFITQDPCIMCAMALVHSRVKRVFILNSGDISFQECSDKAFQVHRLHCLSNLNHHFEVYLVHHDSSQISDWINLSKNELLDCPVKKRKLVSS